MWAERFVSGARAFELREAIEFRLARGHNPEQRLDELAFLERAIKHERTYIRGEMRRGAWA